MLSAALTSTRGRLNGVSYDLMARPRHVGNMHQSRAAERALHFIGGR